MVAYLRLALNPHDDAAFTRVLNTPPRRLPDDFRRELSDARDARLTEVPPQERPRHLQAIPVPANGAGPGNGAGAPGTPARGAARAAVQFQQAAQVQPPGSATKQQAAERERVRQSDINSAARSGATLYAVACEVRGRCDYSWPVCCQQAQQHFD